MSLQPIILDTDKTAPFYELPLKIRQGDTGDELQVTLGKSFQKYTDLSKVDVELIAKTPDQRLIKQPVTDKSENTFKVKFPDEMYTNVGVFRNMYFKIGDDSTSSVKLVVLQGIESVKEAGSYIDDFETLTKEAESYVLALKDFADTGNAKIDNKVAELTGKMTDFVDKSKEDLDAAKAAWDTFQSSSQTAFTDAQDKRASDFNSQRSGFETGFNEQKADFENRFKALLTTLQGDYDDFKALINKDVADFNTSLDSLNSQATDVKNKYDALKAQLDSAAQNISGVRTNLLTGTSSSEQSFTGDFSTVSGWVNDSALTPVIAINAGNTYTYSIHLTKLTGSFALGYWGYDSNKKYAGWFPSANYSSSGKVSWKFTIPSGISYISPHIVKKSDDFACTAKEEKLELGTTATDWCPNPSEIATQSDYAKINAAIQAELGTVPTDSTVMNEIGKSQSDAKTAKDTADSIQAKLGNVPADSTVMDEIGKSQSDAKTAKDTADSIQAKLGNVPADSTVMDEIGKSQGISDTGWVPVSLMNGWTGQVNVRLRDGVVYHNGYINTKGMTDSGVFKYPDSFGDMTILNNFGSFRSTWVGYSVGTVVAGSIDGAEKEFFCSSEGGRTGVIITLSHIVFKL